MSSGRNLDCATCGHSLATGRVVTGGIVCTRCGTVRRRSKPQATGLPPEQIHSEEAEQPRQQDPSQQTCALCRGKFLLQQLIPRGDTHVCFNCFALATGGAVTPPAPQPATTAVPADYAEPDATEQEVSGLVACGQCGGGFAPEELIEHWGQALCTGCLARLQNSQQAARRRPLPRRSSSAMPVAALSVVGIFLVIGAIFLLRPKSHTPPATSSAPAKTALDVEAVNALIREANTLVAANDLPGALARYDRLEQLTAGQTISDASLRNNLDLVAKARQRVVERLKGSANGQRGTVPGDDRRQQRPANPNAHTPARPPAPEPVAIPSSAPEPEPAERPTVPVPANIEQPPAPQTQPSAEPWTRLRPSTRPSTREAVAAESKLLQRLVQQASDALWAGEAASAIELLLDARTLLTRIRLHDATLALDTEGQMHHALAVAYMQQGKFDKARPSVERAAELMPTQRTVLINRAVSDIVRKVTVLQAVRTLRDYFITRLEELDEPTLNILGTALGSAPQPDAPGVPDLAQRLIRESWGLYEQGKTRLEQTRPNERRWGIRWVTPAELRDLERQQRLAKERHQLTLEELQRARLDLKQAQEYLTRERSRMLLTGRGNVEFARTNVQRQEQRVAAQQATVERAYQAIPREPWLTRMEPVLPDSAPLPMAAVRQPERQTRIHQQPRVVAPPPPPPPVAVAPAAPTMPGAGQPPAPPPVAPVTPVVRVAIPEKVVFTRQAVAFPVGPDLLLTAAAPLDGAVRITADSENGKTFEVTVLRKEADLALLRCPRAMASLPLAGEFAGGELRCAAFVAVSIFDIVPEVLKGRAGQPRGAEWTISLSRNPRLPGSPLLDAQGQVVGMAIPQRESEAGQIPAIPLSRLREFCGQDLPRAGGPRANAAAILELTAVCERQ